MMKQLEQFRSAHPQLDPLASVDLLIPDLNGLVRGKRVRGEDLETVLQEGFCLPQSLYGSDVCGATVAETGLGIASGDKDLICRVDPATLRPVPWAAAPAAQCLFEMYDAQGQPFAASPRQRLGEVIARLAAAGIYPTVAVELEFYLFRQGLDTNGHPQPVIDPQSGQALSSTQVYSIDDLDRFTTFIDRVQNYCDAQQVPAGAAVAEYAPGQFEINLKHCDDPLAACDQALLLKRIVRKAAQAEDMLASFMAKPIAEQTGSGMHIHVSLGDGEGGNRLSEDQSLLQQAVGGLQATMGDAMLAWAPHANSYRRFQQHAYVPLSPTWGYNNRTVALRIPAGSASDRRIEHRVAGADANPYLVMSAVLAGIGHGVANQILADEPHSGDAAVATEPSLPLDWRSAIEAFSGSEWARDWLGSPLVDLFGQIKTSEYEDYRRHVSELDVRWYLTTV